MGMCLHIRMFVEWYGMCVCVCVGGAYFYCQHLSLLKSRCPHKCWRDFYLCPHTRGVYIVVYARTTLSMLYNNEGEEKRGTRCASRSMYYTIYCDARGAEVPQEHARSSSPISQGCELFACGICCWNAAEPTKNDRAMWCVYYFYFTPHQWCDVQSFAEARCFWRSFIQIFARPFFYPFAHIEVVCVCVCAFGCQTSMHKAPYSTE